MKKRVPKKKAARKEPRKKKLRFDERGWIAQIKEFQRAQDPHFIWGRDLLMEMAHAENWKDRQPLEAKLDRKLKQLNREGNQEAIRAIVASFIAFNQGGLIRSTLKVVEITGWADRIPHKNT